jgi:hypothetical protein
MKGTHKIAVDNDLIIKTAEDLKIRKLQRDILLRLEDLNPRDLGILQDLAKPKPPEKKKVSRKKNSGKTKRVQEQKQEDVNSVS